MWGIKNDEKRNTILKTELLEVEKLIGDITEKVEEMNDSRERMIVLADTFRAAIDSDQLELDVSPESK